MGKKRQRPWGASSFQTTVQRVGAASSSSCFVWWKTILLLSSWGTTTFAAENELSTNPHHHNVFIHNHNNLVANNAVVAAKKLDNAAYTQCAVSMVLNDANRDNQLNEAEFIRFLGRLITNNAVNTIAESFDPSLALSAQAEVFQTLFQRALQEQQQGDATTINVQGARPGTSQNADQLSFLRDFCSWTYEAIEAWQNPETAVPTVTPTTAVPTAAPTTAKPTTVAPTAIPTTVTPTATPTSTATTIPPTLVPSTASSLEPQATEAPTAISSSTLAPTNRSHVPSETPSAPSTTLPESTAVPTTTPSTVAPSQPPTQAPSSNAPTLPAGSFVMTLYNSFVVGNTQGLKAWDLTLRGQVAKLNQAYRAFLTNVAATARVAPQSSSAASEIQTSSLYRILNSPCPTWFQPLEPGDTLACQSVYGSFDLMITGWVDDDSNHNNTQAFLEDLYSNQTQQAILNGVLQFFVNEQRGDSTAFYLKILGEATSLMAPDTMFPTPGPSTIAPTRSPSSTQEPTVLGSFATAPSTRSPSSTQVPTTPGNFTNATPTHSPLSTQAPTVVSTWSATIYNGFAVAYNVTEAPNNNTFPNDYWATDNSTITNGGDATWIQDLQNVYRSFVNRTVSQVLGENEQNRSRLRRRRRLAVLGGSLESAQIYQVNQGNCNQGPWNDTSTWTCRDVFASFDLILANETSQEEIVTLYTNATQRAIEDGQLQTEVENANLSTSFTIMGSTENNVPDLNDVSQTNAPTPTLNDSNVLSPTSAPTTGATKEPTTIAPSIRLPRATTAPARTPTISPTDFKTRLPPRSQAPQLGQSNVDPSPAGASSSNTVAILAVGAAMLLLGCNIGFACCLCFRRKRGRTGATDEGVPPPGVTVKETLAPSPAPTNEVVVDGQGRITLTVADLMEFVDVKSSELIQKIQELVPTPESVIADDEDALWSSKKEHTDNSAKTDDENPLWPNKTDSGSNGAGNSTDSGDEELWPEEEKNCDESAESSMDLAEIGLVSPPDIQPAALPDKVKSDDEGVSTSLDNQQASRVGKSMNGVVQHEDGSANKPDNSVKVAAQTKGNHSDIQQTSEPIETEKNLSGTVDGAPDDQASNQPEGMVEAANEADSDQSDDKQVEESNQSANIAEVDGCGSDGTVLGGSALGGQQLNQAEDKKEAMNEDVDSGHSDDPQIEDPNISAKSLAEDRSQLDGTSEGTDENLVTSQEQQNTESQVLGAHGASASCVDDTPEDAATDRECQDDIFSENSQGAKIQTSEGHYENDEMEQTPTSENNDAIGSHASSSSSSSLSSSSDTGDNRTDSVDVVGSPPDSEVVSTQSETEDKQGEAASLSESASTESNNSAEVQDTGAAPSVDDEPSASAEGSDESGRAVSIENETSGSTDGSDSGDSAEKFIDYREKVIQLLQQVMPDEVNNVDIIMEQFEGREEELIETLLQQDASSSEYTSDDDGDAPTTDSGGSSSFAATNSVPTSDDASYSYRGRIIQLMEEVMPDEINNVDVVMEQFQGRERELIETLENMVNGDEDDMEGGDSEFDESSGEESDG